MDDRFELRVVPLGDVVPHEESEPRRVAKIVGRLAGDTVLANPPVVAEADGRLVLLDGANRIGALRVLDYRYAIVQVVPPARLRLDMWHHALLDITPERLLTALDAVRGVTLTEDGADGVCRLLVADGREYAVTPDDGVHPFTALGALVGGYVERSVIRRTTEPFTATHPDAAAVVRFPSLTLDDVFGAVRVGARLPAGITRFLVDGRVLLLNAPLDPLRSDRPVDELNEWLTGLVAGRRAEGKLRHYPEPVFVLDD
ncbi:MAG TPA: hypothetical protein VGD67_23520 [Pseudonocardiaceae bacterium]